MADFKAFDAAVAQLSTDFDVYKTAVDGKLAGVQPAIDAATATVVAVDKKVTDATVALG